jgi:hypothetical protein
MRIDENQASCIWYFVSFGTHCWQSILTFSLACPILILSICSRPYHTIDSGMHFEFCAVLYLQFSWIGSYPRKFTPTKVYICENLDWVLVQWQNMAVHKYKNMVITIILDPLKFHPTKIQAYCIQ